MKGPGKGADAGAFAAARALIDSVEAASGSGPSDGPGPSSFVDRLLALAEPSRAARKGVAAAVQRSSLALRALAQRADMGEDEPPETLLRRARGADTVAQVRKNPIHRNEGFLCLHCAHDVPPAPGGGIRNHCPRCLRSCHVDGPVPGDRAAACGGVMDPSDLNLAGGQASVLHRCRRCGHARRNRLHAEWGVDPDQLPA